jgi:hypothetical protein
MGGGGASGASAAKTIVSKFNIEIEAFFKQLLTGANPKFIRCINPRPKGIAAPDTMGKRFNLQRVLVQVPLGCHLYHSLILALDRLRLAGIHVCQKRSCYEHISHWNRAARSVCSCATRASWIPCACAPPATSSGKSRRWHESKRQEISVVASSVLTAKLAGKSLRTSLRRTSTPATCESQPAT